MDQDQEHVGRVRRRRSQAEAEQVVADYQASGLSQSEFCRTRGLALATLARYRKRCGQQAETAGASRWVAVELTDPGRSSGLAMVLPGGRRIEVGRGFDATTLAQLLRALE